MRSILFLLLLISARIASANMASPILDGTIHANPFLPNHADILFEKILIVPDKDFKTAFFRVEYTIHTDKSGNQVPLLFYASEYDHDFKVWMDDKEVYSSPVRSSYRMNFGTGLRHFEELYSQVEAVNRTVADDTLETWLQIEEENLHFFEVNIPKGNHVFRIEYTATNWEDRSEWIARYSFRYVLAPARFWKSFGGLEVTIDNSHFNRELELLASGKQLVPAGQTSIFKFTSLPGDFLQLNFSPAMGGFATFLTKLNPFLFSVFCGILLIVLHVVFMRLYRRKYPNKRFSFVMIVGSFIVAFMIPFSYVMYFELVDALIGEYASRFHGYTFMMMLLFPPLLFVYWAAMWRVDVWLKSRFVIDEKGQVVLPNNR